MKHNVGMALAEAMAYESVPENVKNRHIEELM
jgi:hypothetical protein